MMARKKTQKKQTQKTVDIPSSNEQLNLFMNRIRKNETDQLAKIVLQLKKFHIHADGHGRMTISLAEKLYAANRTKLEKAGWLFSYQGPSGRTIIYVVEIKGI